MEPTFNRENLFLAELKYFDKEHNGIEYCPAVSYVALYKYNDIYVNLLNLDEFYPIFKRVPGTYNITSDDRVYGSKVISLSGDDVSSGPCLLISDDQTFRYSFNNEFDLYDLKRIILSSKLYFKDRINFINNKEFKYFGKKKLLSLMKDDFSKEQEMLKFFDDRNVKYTKIKK